MLRQIKDFQSLLSWVERNPEEAALQIQQLTGRLSSFEDVISKMNNLNSNELKEWSR